MRNIMLALAFLVCTTTASAQAVRPVQIVYLDHLEARSTVDIVARLLGPDGICAAHVETNSLIVIDDAAHIARIREVVQRLEERAAQRRSARQQGTNR